MSKTMIPAEVLDRLVQTTRGENFDDGSTFGDVVITALDAPDNRKRVKARKAFAIQTAIVAHDGLEMDDSDFKDLVGSVEECSALRSFVIGQVLEALEECNTNGKADPKGKGGEPDSSEIP